MSGDERAGTYAVDWVEPQPRRGTRFLPSWEVVRWVLFAGSLVFVAVMALGSLESTYADLDDDLRSGRVESVQVVSEGRDPYDDSTTYEVRWRDGLLGRQTRLEQVDPGEESEVVRPYAVHAIDADPREWLTDRYDVRVERLPEWRTRAFAIDVWRGGPQMQISDWWAPPLLFLGFLAVYVFLVVGPEPRRLTRYGWFWLLLSSWLVVPAYLLLSRQPGGADDDRPAGRRLSGWWTFPVWTAVVVVFSKYLLDL